MDSNNANSEATSSRAASGASSSPSSSSVSEPTQSTATASSVSNELRESSSLSPESSTVLHIPDGVQMASSASNEPEISSSRPQLNYSLPNARPPGTVNVNHGYEHDLPKNSKDEDPPSYEEAIKAMEYYKQNPVGQQVIQDDGDLLQTHQQQQYHHHHHHYPDNGQFAVRDQYFYPQSYQSCDSSDLDVELKKSVCARLVFTMILVGFTVLAVRMLFFLN